MSSLLLEKRRRNWWLFLLMIIRNEQKERKTIFSWIESPNETSRAHKSKLKEKKCWVSDLMMMRSFEKPETTFHNTKYAILSLRQAVERALLELPAVSTGCVLVKGQEGEDKFLVAYVVPGERGFATFSTRSLSIYCEEVKKVSFTSLCLRSLKA